MKNLGVMNMKLFHLYWVGKVFLLDFFYIPLEFQYYISPLPGEKDGISAILIYNTIEWNDFYIIYNY